MCSLEKYLEAYDEQMPFHCMGENLQHEWLMSIENVKFDVKRFEYCYIDRQRSKSAPYDENYNEDWLPCSSTRQSRRDTRKSVGFSDEAINQMISDYIGNAEPSGLSTPIEESPEKEVNEKPSCLKKNFAQKNTKEKQIQGKSGQGASKGKNAVKQRGKSENRSDKKVIKHY